MSKGVRINSRKILVVGALYVLLALSVFLFIGRLELRPSPSGVLLAFVCVFAASFVAGLAYAQNIACRRSKWTGLLALLALFGLASALAVITGRVAALIESDSVRYMITDLRFPLVGLFSGIASLLLANAFIKSRKSIIDILAALYFGITGLGLTLHFFVADALIGLMKLIGD